MGRLGSSLYAREAHLGPGEVSRIRRLGRHSQTEGDHGKQGGWPRFRAWAHTSTLRHPWDVGWIIGVRVRLRWVGQLARCRAIAQRHQGRTGLGHAKSSAQCHIKRRILRGTNRPAAAVRTVEGESRRAHGWRHQKSPAEHQKLGRIPRGQNAIRALAVFCAYRRIKGRPMQSTKCEDIKRKSRTTSWGVSLSDRARSVARENAGASERRFQIRCEQPPFAILAFNAQTYPALCIRETLVAAASFLLMVGALFAPE